MGKQQRDRVQVYFTPRDREALTAILEAIAPGLSKERGEASDAVLRMVRLGMAAYASNPSLRLSQPPEPAALSRAVHLARAREERAAGLPPDEMSRGSFNAALSAPAPAEDPSAATLAADREAKALSDRAEKERARLIAQETATPKPPARRKKP